MRAEFIGGPWHGQRKNIPGAQGATHAPINVYAPKQPALMLRDMGETLFDQPETVTYRLIREHQVLDVRSRYQERYYEYEVAW